MCCASMKDVSLLLNILENWVKRDIGLLLENLKRSPDFNTGMIFANFISVRNDPQINDKMFAL